MKWLFLPPSAELEVHAESKAYLLSDEAEGAWLALSECAERVQQQELTLVLPMECCSAFAVQLPTQKASWLRRALPYAVEEMLAEDVEQFHLSLGEQLGDGRHRVIAVQRKRLVDCLEQLHALGLQVGAIHCDADLLPHDGKQLLLMGGRALLGGGIEERVVFAPELWPAMARLCVDITQAHGLDEEPPTDIEPYRQLNDPYRLLVEGGVAAVDLAQGEFARQKKPTWRLYGKMLGGVVALILVLQLSFTMAQGWYLERQGEHYAQASRTLYQELFPQDQRIVNIRAQFEEHMTHGTQFQQGRFFRVLEQLTPELTKAGSPLTVVQLDYSESRGDLVIQVQATDFIELEKLRQRLIAAGLAVQLGSSSRDKQGVIAQLVIKVNA